MIVGIIIATVIALSSCDPPRQKIEVTSTFEVTFNNGDKELFKITAIDMQYKDEINGAYLVDGCLRYRIKDDRAIGGVTFTSLACNVRSFKLKP